MRIGMDVIMVLCVLEDFSSINANKEILDLTIDSMNIILYINVNVNVNASVNK